MRLICIVTSVALNSLPVQLFVITVVLRNHFPVRVKNAALSLLSRASFVLNAGQEGRADYE